MKTNDKATHAFIEPLIHHCPFRRTWSLLATSSLIYLGGDHRQTAPKRNAKVSEAFPWYPDLLFRAL